MQCAWAAKKKKDSYLQAQFYRIKARRGPKKAIMAVAASILTAIYHMLKDGTMYQDLGRKPFDRRSLDQQKRSLVKRLADLGYTVEVKPLTRGTAGSLWRVPCPPSFLIGDLPTQGRSENVPRTTMVAFGPGRHDRPAGLSGSVGSIC